MRRILLCLGLVAAAVLMLGIARAGEDDVPPDELRHILERADRGEPIKPHALQIIDRFAKDHLFRVPCNVLEDSRFSLAQLQLRTGEGEQALETLQKLAAATKSDDVRSAAMYDIGRVHQVGLKDVDSAAGVYAKVTGRFRSMALRSLVLMYVEAGQAAKAVALLKDQAAKAKDKGEKLALLRRLGQIARHAGDNDAAIAAYKQISDEFTEQDIEAIRAAAAKRARDTFAKAIEHRKAGRWREAEQTIRGLRGWAAQLLVAGRADEFHAVRQEHERHEQAMDELERRHEEEEEGEHEDGDERDDEGEDRGEEDRGVDLDE